MRWELSGLMSLTLSAVPAGRVERIERIDHGRDLAAAADQHPPFIFVLLGLERLVDLRRLQHGFVIDCMPADHAAIRRLDGAVGAFEQQHGHRLRTLDPPHGRARQHDVVALLERQISVIAEQRAAPAMNE
jgi:hypothetical protein